MGVLLRKKPDGAWWVFINHRGRRKAKKVGDKEAAKEVARKIQAALAAGELSLARPDAPPFKEHAERWLRQYPQVANIKESTLEQYEKALRLYVLPAFGDKPLTEITRAAVKDFLSQLRTSGSIKRKGEGLGASAAKGTLAPLRLVLEDALDNGLIQANPAARVGKWNKRKTEREAEGRKDPFTAEELEAIATVAQEQVTLLWPLVGVWAQGGMREGEAFGLQWKDLDLEAGTAIVRRTMSKGRIGSPKTGRARVVSFMHQTLERPEAVLEALRELRSVREAEAALQGKPLDPDAHVFLRGDGRPFTCETLHHLWHRCLKAAGVRYRYPEQLRHTWASTLLSRGESLLYVQEQGGWTNANTVLKDYARWLPRQAPRLQPAATPAQPGQEARVSS